MNEAIIDAVTRIANHIHKRKGHLITISHHDVETVLEAEMLLIEQMERYYATTANASEQAAS